MFLEYQSEAAPDSITLTQPRLFNLLLQCNALRFTWLLREYPILPLPELLHRHKE